MCPCFGGGGAATLLVLLQADPCCTVLTASHTSAAGMLLTTSRRVPRTWVTRHRARHKLATMRPASARDRCIFCGLTVLL